MTPEQKLKALIIHNAYSWGEEKAPDITDDNVDALYAEMVEKDEHWDSKNEIRSGQVVTEIPSDYSRHYESKSVAAKALDGSWVGWTYWYGGGKHAEPEAIDWMNEAYNLECKEEEKTLIVQTFSKIETVSM